MKKFTFIFPAIIFYIFLVLINGYLIPPSFGGTDIYYFKDAGINYSEGLGFVSRFTYGNPTFEYKTYSTYPPFYPLLFGVFVKYFGISPESNQIFNTLISGATGLTGFLVLKSNIDYKQKNFHGIFILAISIIYGFFISDIDRPDSLALCISFIALGLLILKASRLNYFLIGCLSALCIFISPYTGLWISFAVMVITLIQHQEDTVVDKHKNLFFMVVFGGVITTLFVLIGLFLYLPEWISAFKGVLTGSNTNNETGGGYFLALLNGDFTTWFSGIPIKWTSFYVEFFKLLIVESSLALAVILDGYRKTTNFASVGIVALLVFSPLCIIIAPYQVHYITISSVLLLSCASVLVYKMPSSSKKKYIYAIFTSFYCLAIINFPWLIRDLGVRITSNSSMKDAYHLIEDFKKSIDLDKSIISVSPSSYLLWREAGVHPLLVSFSGFDKASNRVNLDYVALSFPGSGNTREPQKPIWFDESEYERISKPIIPRDEILFGLFNSKSSQTWENAIYKRRNLVD